MKKCNSRNSKTKLASKFKCTGCLSCADVCKHNAIESFIDSDGHYYVNIDHNKCTNCGLCSKSCPIKSKQKIKINIDKRNVYAGWAKDEIFRKKSSSGGVAAALALNVLKNGGVVIGASIDGINVKHTLIDNIADLYKIQGTKYLQSNTTGIYNITKECLNKYPIVLFTGTPCQIAGLYSTIKGTENYKNLITCDLICGGVPSKLLFDFFLSSYKDIRSIITFRDKSKGWKSTGFKYDLKLSTNKNTIITCEYDSNVFLKGFSSAFTNRFSCNNCKFANLKRISDITLGDFWGLKNFKEQHKNGVSLVFSNSSKGEALLQNSEIELTPTNLKEALSHNPRMIIGIRPLYRFHLGRIFIAVIFKYLNSSIIVTIYTGSGNKNNIIGVILKLYNYFHYKCNTIFQSLALNYKLNFRNIK